MKFGMTNSSSEIICSIRSFLIEVYNSYAEEKIYSNGNEDIDIFKDLKDYPKQGEKSTKVIKFILEIEGFEEANECLSEKEKIKKLKELDKRIRKELQEV